MVKPKREQNIKIPDNIIEQLLTPSEFRMLKNRFQIMNLLEEGLSVRKISAMLKVGTDTVVRVMRMLEKSNLRNLLDNNRKRMRQVKTQTPWIFGKSE